MPARLDIRLKRSYGPADEARIVMIAMEAIEHEPQLSEVNAVLSNGKGVSGKTARGRKPVAAAKARTTKRVAEKAKGAGGGTGSGLAKKTAAKGPAKKVVKKRKPLSAESRAKLAQNLVKARAARARKLKAAKRAAKKSARKTTKKRIAKKR